LASKYVLTAAGMEEAVKSEMFRAGGLCPGPPGPPAGGLGSNWKFASKWNSFLAVPIVTPTWYSTMMESLEMATA
jgi:hypothetical protein